MKINSLDRMNQPSFNEVNVRNLKVGDIVKGRVVNNENGLITLRTSGDQLLSALFLPDENLIEEKVISIIINKITDDNIYAKILNTDDFDNKVEKNVNLMIQELSIGKSNASKDILQSLLKFLQPINKDKIEYFDYLLKASELIKSNKNEILSNLLISEESFLELPIDILNKMPLMSEQTNYYDYISSFLSEDDIQHLKPEDYGLFLTRIAEIFDLEEDAANGLKNLIFQGNKTIESIETINKEIVSYLLSKDLEVTPQNIFVLNHLISDGRGLADYLTEIIDTIDGTNYKELISQSKELLRVFLEIDKLDKNTYSNQIVKLIKSVKKLEETIEKNHITNFGLKDNIHNLKSTLLLIKSINEHFNYYNIPILVNDFKASADIYIYKRGKRGKKVDLSDASILISLDLEYLGHIESLIHISNKLINIVFKTENKIISSLFNSYSETLVHLLESKGYGAVISVTEKKDKKINPISFENNLNKDRSYRQGIDVRL